MPGQRQLDVDEIHDERVDASAEIAADQSERRADQTGNDRRAKPDHERDARAVDHPAEIIAPKRVGAERCAQEPSGVPDRLDQAAVRSCA